MTTYAAPPRPARRYSTSAKAATKQQPSSLVGIAKRWRNPGVPTLHSNLMPKMGRSALPVKMQTAIKREVDLHTAAGSDAITVGAISLLASMLGNLLHEGAGHGGACLLSGAQPLVLSSVHFECSVDARLVMAGGTLANFIAGALFFFLGRMSGRNYPRWKYFCWIAMTVNLFTATGYFLFSGIGGIGDWARFIRGLGPQWLWRIGLTIFGAVTYFLAARLSLFELRPLIGSNQEQRYQRTVR